MLTKQEVRDTLYRHLKLSKEIKSVEPSKGGFIVTLDSGQKYDCYEGDGEEMDTKMIVFDLSGDYPALNLDRGREAKTRQVNIRFTPRLIERAERIAEAKGLDFSTVVRTAVDEYCTKHKEIPEKINQFSAK